MPKKEKLKYNYQNIDPKVDWGFTQYFDTMIFLANMIPWETTREYPRGSIERSAYHNTSQYQELRKIAGLGGLIYAVPVIEDYWDSTSYRTCIYNFWEKVRSVGVSEETISLLQERYNQHLTEVSNFQKNRIETKKTLMENFKKIGKQPAYLNKGK